MQARLEGDLPCEMVSVIQLVDLAGSKSIHDEVRMDYPEYNSNPGCLHRRACMYIVIISGTYNLATLKEANWNTIQVNQSALSLLTTWQ